MQSNSGTLGENQRGQRSYNIVKRTTMCIKNIGEFLKRTNAATSTTKPIAGSMIEVDTGGATASAQT